MIENFKVAIDGPVGSGKTTIGHLLAQRLAYNFLDSGLLFRHFAQFFLDNAELPINLVLNNSSPTEVDQLISRWQELLVNNQAELVIMLEKNRVLLSSPSVSDLASQLSLNPKLRQVIADFQRELTKNSGWVVVGRDITSEILPTAEVKIFLTADLKVRAKRRYEQYQGRKSQDEVEKELKKRDERDTERTIAPLKKTVDSWELDTTYLSPKEAVEKILIHINSKSYEKEKNQES